MNTEETTVTLSLNITTRRKATTLNIITTSKVINELNINSQHTYQNVGQTSELIKLFTTFTKQLNQNKK